MSAPTGSRILVTGATGFVGRSLCAHLAGRHTVLGGIRTRSSAHLLPPDVTPVVLGELGDASPDLDLGRADIVVHAAGLAHVTDRSRQEEGAFERINVGGTLRVARAAMAQGVRRFVHISSIGVNGPSSGQRAFSEGDPVGARTAYARSKARAEAELWNVSDGADMEVVVLRPPLVYGPQAPGNFARLVGLVRRGLPLPLGSIRNRRSMIYIGNLVDGIELAATHPRAPGELFLIADAEQVSTPQLIRLVAHGLGVVPRLLPCPVAILEMGSAVLGKAGEIRQLTRSLVLSTEKIATVLGWHPPYPLETALLAALSGAPVPEAPSVATRSQQ